MDYPLDTTLQDINLDTYIVSFKTDPFQIVYISKGSGEVQHNPPKPCRAISYPIGCRDLIMEADAENDAHLVHKKLDEARQKIFSES